MNFNQLNDFALSSTVLPNTFMLAVASTVCVYRVVKLRKERQVLGARWLNLLDFTIILFALFLQSCAASWSRLGRSLDIYELHDADELLMVVRVLIFFAATRLVYRMAHLRWRTFVIRLSILGAIILMILSGLFALHFKLYCGPSC